MLAGNRLHREHISEWNRHIMKVEFAVQRLTNSTADALQFCHDVGESGFEDVEGTVNFIKMVDRLFDMNNSRSPAAARWLQLMRLYFPGKLTNTHIDTDRVLYTDRFVYLYSSTLPLFEAVFRPDRNKSSGTAQAHWQGRPRHTQENLRLGLCLPHALYCSSGTGVVWRTATHALPFNVQALPGQH